LGLQNEDKTTAYSSLLSDEAAVYEVSIEDVNPKDWEQYLQQKGSLIYEFRMGCFGEKNSFSKSANPLVAMTMKLSNYTM
jgi:hypothetical protein